MRISTPPARSAGTMRGRSPVRPRRRPRTRSREGGLSHHTRGTRGRSHIRPTTASHPAWTAGPEPACSARGGEPRCRRVPRRPEFLDVDAAMPKPVPGCERCAPGTRRCDRLGLDMNQHRAPWPGLYATAGHGDRPSDEGQTRARSLLSRLGPDVLACWPSAGLACPGCYGRSPRRRDE